MEYEKEIIIKDKNEKEKNFQIINCILTTKDELNKARNNYEFAENELIDFYSYQIMALQCKLDYLTRLAKYQKIDFNSMQKNAI